MKDFPNEQDAACFSERKKKNKVKNLLEKQFIEKGS